MGLPLTDTISSGPPVPASGGSLSTHYPCSLGPVYWYLTSSKGLSSLKVRFLSQDYEGDFGSQGGALGPLFVGVEGPTTDCRTYFKPIWKAAACFARIPSAQLAAPNQSATLRTPNTSPN